MFEFHLIGLPNRWQRQGYYQRLQSTTHIQHTKHMSMWTLYITQKNSVYFPGYLSKGSNLSTMFFSKKTPPSVLHGSFHTGGCTGTFRGSVRCSKDNATVVVVTHSLSHPNFPSNSGYLKRQPSIHKTSKLPLSPQVLIHIQFVDLLTKMLCPPALNRIKNT